MKKSVRGLSVLIILCLLLGALQTFSAAEQSSVTALQLKTMFADGSYWNSGDPRTTTDSPCTHHKSGCSYSGSCGCNSYNGKAIQCMGFAFQLAFEIYGGDPYYDWTKYISSSSLDDLKPGDIVRYRNNGHSIFVTAVEGDTVTYADCNWNHNCKIRWDVTITKQKLKESFTYVAKAPYAWDGTESGETGEGSGGDSEEDMPLPPACPCSDFYAGTYKCTTRCSSLRIRSDHSTSSQVLGSIPPGAELKVTMSDGSWAHVVYNGISGYASMEYLALVKSDLKDSSELFTDIPKDAWYKMYVDYAVTKGIFSGSSDTEFSPDMPLTRAQAVMIFANISGVGTDDNNVDSGFLDVPKNQWYTAAVKWAAENGVVSGDGNGNFNPDGLITREQMCVMIVNFIENYQGETLETVNESLPFADDDTISSWAKEAVYKCKNANLVSGDPNGNFNPLNTASRAEGATIFADFHKSYIA